MFTKNCGWTNIGQQLAAAVDPEGRRETLADWFIISLLIIWILIIICDNNNDNNDNKKNQSVSVSASCLFGAVD